MTPTQQKIMDRLRSGGLRTDQFSEVDVIDTPCLKVQITYMRRELKMHGLTIVCERPKHEPFADRRTGARTYKLARI